MKKIVFLIVILMLSALLFPLVKNPDKPLKGVWDFKPEKAWEIENAGDEVIGKIGQIEVNQDETLYVFDRLGINYIFDKNGTFIKSFAKKGEGPGEIRMQRKLFCIKDMILIYVYLSGIGPSYRHQQDIDIFSLDGKFLYRSCIKFDKDSEIIEAFFTRGILIRKDSVYAGLEDEEGNVKIAKYKIILPDVQ